ncbi:MAG: ABC transporter permease [Nitrososphaerota archaeon]
MTLQKALSKSLRIFGILKRVLKFSKKFRIGFILFLAILALGLASNFSPPYYSYLYYLPTGMQPKFESIDLIFGTTADGRSVFWALTHAIMNSLIIAFVTAMIACHIGLVFGLIAGMKGGAVDKTVMFITDAFIAIPGLPLTIMLVMILKPIVNLIIIGIIISIISWPWSSRMIRAMALSIKEKDFITSAQLSGMSTLKIIFLEIFPHILGFHLTNIINTMLGAIGAEVGLAFLGLSILEIDTLGTMIYWIQRYGAMLRNMWWWVLPPVMTLIFLFIALYLISAGLQEYLNPRLRGGR